MLSTWTGLKFCRFVKELRSCSLHFLNLQAFEKQPLIAAFESTKTWRKRQSMVRKDSKTWQTYMDPYSLI